MICCVTGHRPKGFPFLRDNSEIAYMLYSYRLHMEIEKLIREGKTIRYIMLDEIASLYPKY